MRFREEYWYWMYHNIKFSRYDRRFIQDVYSKRIFKNLSVSPKQAELWETIVFKYHKQIQEQNLDPDTILAAPWRAAPRVPLPNHERYELLLRVNMMVMRSPYNKEHVDRWRTFRNQRAITNTTWDPDAKEWWIEVTATNLKAMIEYCQTSDPEYHIHDSIMDLLDDTLVNSNADQWSVIAKLVNQRIVINCANEHLMQALPQELPIDVSTLDRLVQAGVVIDDQLRHYCGIKIGDPEVATLNSERISVMSWSRANQQAILRYLEQYSDANIVVEIFGTPDGYTEIVNEIMIRYPNRVQAYTEQKKKVEDSIFEFASESYDFSRIDFNLVDIVINRSRSLMSWDPSSYPAKVAKKVIYYIDPKHERDDYLDPSHVLLW